MENKQNNDFKENMIVKYKELNKKMESHIAGIFLVVVIMLAWNLFLGDLYAHSKFNGSWEADDVEVVISGSSCSVYYDGDKYDEEITCSTSNGVLYIESRGEDTAMVGIIANGRLYLTNMESYRKN